MKAVILGLALACVTAPAFAAPNLDVHALALADENVRYLKGIPTLDLLQQRGAVQVRFVSWDHDNAVFAVAAFNGSSAPTNLGVENFSALGSGADLRIFTADQLARKAKNRAMWSQIGLALLGGVAAASAANQRSHYHGSVVGPSGVYSFSGSYPSLAGQLRANQISADTAAAIASIRYGLDSTIQAIGDRVLQTTTVDPGQSFGGLVFVEKPDAGKLPRDLRLSVNWNGERYDFAYLITKKGQPVPAEWSERLASRKSPGKLIDPAAALENNASPAPSQSQPTQAPSRRPVGEIYLTSGAVKVPADTPSGFCLRTPAGYQATGSANAPVITKVLPRCQQNGS